MNGGLILHKTEQFILGPEHPAFERICELSNYAARVRNQALYRMRKDWKANGKWSEPNTRKAMNGEGYEFFKAMPYKAAQEASRMAAQELKSYAMAKKKGVKSARIPGYLPHTGRAVLTFFAPYAVSVPKMRKGIINVGGIDDDLVKVTRCGKIKQVRIVPRKHVFIVEIVHEIKAKKRVVDGPEAGLDLGVNNIASVIIDQPGVRPLLVCGKRIKSINQRYNKELAKQKSRLPQGVHWTKELQKVTDNRNKRIKHLLHSASRAIVDYLSESGVSRLVIGWNSGLKNGESKMGKKFNQIIRHIPWRVLVDQITYKCAMRGIEVIEIEESYTSKTSVVDGELPHHHSSYAGKRIRRGMFRASDGTLINADINGAAQIVRKCNPAAFSHLRIGNGLRAPVVLSPVKVRVGGGPHAV